MAARILLTLGCDRCAVELAGPNHEKAWVVSPLAERLLGSQGALLLGLNHVRQRSQLSEIIDTRGLDCESLCGQQLVQLLVRVLRLVRMEDLVSEPREQVRSVTDVGVQALKLFIQSPE